MYEQHSQHSDISDVSAPLVNPLPMDQVVTTGQELSHPSQRLLQSIDGSLSRLEGRSVMMGIGFGREGTPIDVAAMVLAAASARSITVFIIDEFHRMNEVPEDEIARGTARLEHVLARMKEVCDLPLEVVRASDLMATEEYHAKYLGIAAQIAEAMQDESFAKAMLATLPPSKRAEACPDLTYSVHEMAVVAFMAESRGIEVKLGPSRETLYDGIMRTLGIPMQYAYAIDALPIATDKPEAVVHYVPSHRGAHGGQRICFEDPRRKIAEKLEFASDQTAKYLFELADVARRIRGAGPLADRDPGSMKRKVLVRTVRDGILENLVDLVIGQE